MQPSETLNCFIRLERQSTDSITVSPSCVDMGGTPRVFVNSNDGTVEDRA
jgi:hypothetical protein